MLVTDAERLWKVCAETVRVQVPEPAWRTWFEGVHPVGLEERRLTLGVPSTFVRERLHGEYSAILHSAAADAFGAPVTVELEVRPELIRRGRAKSEPLPLAEMTEERRQSLAALTLAVLPAWGPLVVTAPEPARQVHDLGIELMGRSMLIFETAGLAILLAMVAATAVAIARSP